MGDGPIYAPFFGVMGATSAVAFSGKNTGILNVNFTLLSNLMMNIV